MKKIILGICVCIMLGTIKAEASWGYKYFDAGGLYAGTKFPQSVATDINSSENPVDIYKLKRGESASRNILRLIEIGDASINTAARNGRIKKIHYVDTQISKVYIPILFLPIYAKETKTIVYGE
jgi:hypothetical protein